MSVIAAKVYKNRIEMAADSIVIHGSLKRTNYNKLFEINGMIIGTCGYAEEGAFMRYYAETHKPASSNEKDILRFFVEFQAWKTDAGCTIPDCGNYYLFYFDGHLFCVTDMHVEEIDDFAAIGAGRDFSYAALYLGATPEEAVKVACELSCKVSEPIVKAVGKR